MISVKVTEHDYDRLMMRCGHPDKIHFVVTRLLDLADQAASDVHKWDEWTKAVGAVEPRR